MIKQTPSTVYELLAIQEDDEEVDYNGLMRDCVDTEAFARFVLDATGDLMPSERQLDRAIAALERFKAANPD